MRRAGVRAVSRGNQLAGFHEVSCDSCAQTSLTHGHDDLLLLLFFVLRRLVAGCGQRGVGAALDSLHADASFFAEVRVMELRCKKKWNAIAVGALASADVNITDSQWSMSSERGYPGRSESSQLDRHCAATQKGASGRGRLAVHQQWGAEFRIDLLVVLLLLGLLSRGGPRLPSAGQRDRRAVVISRADRRGRRRYVGAHAPALVAALHPLQPVEELIPRRVHARSTLRQGAARRRAATAPIRPVCSVRIVVAAALPAATEEDHSSPYRPVDPSVPQECALPPPALSSATQPQNAAPSTLDPHAPLRQSTNTSRPPPQGQPTPARSPRW